MTKQSVAAGVISSAETARHAVTDGIANGLEAVRAEAVDIKERASQVASDTADFVEKGIDTAEREADIILDAAKQQASALQKMMADELRTHPLRTLGIAAAVGLVIGYVTTR